MNFTVMTFRNICVCVFLLLISTLLNFAYAATIELSNIASSKSKYIRFSGPIVEGDFNKFKKIVQKTQKEGNQVKLIVLDSTGGLVDQAVLISEFLNKNEMNTVVLSDGTCASSCFLIFMSGKERYADPKSVLMVHRISNLKKKDSIEAKGYSIELNELYKLLNVPDNIRLAMLDTPPEKAFQLSEKDLKSISTTDRLSNIFSSNSSNVKFEEPIQIPAQPLNANIQHGDIVSFGKYPYSDSTKFMPIQWKVAFKMQNQALLIASNGLDTVPFCKMSNKDCSWQNSFLREWLNEQFYKRAFSEDEQKLVQEFVNENARGRKKLSNTRERVFVLSYEETSVYFTKIDDYIALTTPYAAKKGAVINKDGHISWWLRTSSEQASNVYLVNEQGKITQDLNYRNDVTVRPAIWVKFSH